MTAPLTHRQVLSLAWPVMLAQAASALPGIVDTVVMGTSGSATDLAAVAVAAVAFSFLYWGFGFLRMSTTGLTAQAQGRGDSHEVQAQLVRGGLVGVALGALVLLAFPVAETMLLGAFQASSEVEHEATGYMRARIWGAPAALTGFAIQGWLLGVGRTRALLVVQLVLNIGNAVLDAIFVGVLDWGAAGIGAGTAMAEVAACLVGVALVRGSLGWPPSLLDRDKLRLTFSANRDVMVRTIALLGGFAWFVNAGARLGDAVAAGNQVLLQFVSTSAFVLDAYAFVTEKEVGEAVGARSPARLKRAMRVTTELALGSAVVFCLLFAVTAGPIIDAIVADPTARSVAQEFLPFCVMVPLLGVPAWQLDGIFLGAVRGRSLRNAAIVATVAYIALDLGLRQLHLGNTGVWWAFVTMYALRALSLAPGVRGLLASAEEVD